MLSDLRMGLCDICVCLVVLLGLEEVLVNILSTPGGRCRRFDRWRFEEYRRLPCQRSTNRLLLSWCLCLLNFVFGMVDRFCSLCDELILRAFRRVGCCGLNLNGT